jgi:hypothetical protein
VDLLWLIIAHLPYQLLYIVSIVWLPSRKVLLDEDVLRKDAIRVFNGFFGLLDLLLFYVD